MRVRLFKNSLNTNVYVSILILFLAFLSLSSILFYNITSSVRSNQRHNTDIEEANVNFLELSKVKLDFSRIVKDVDYSTILLHNFIITNNHLTEKERNKIWERKVIPRLNEMENSLDAIDNNDFRVRFNALYDNVINVKDIQEEVVNVTSKEKLIDPLVRLSDASMRITNAFNNLVSIEEDQRLQKFEDVRVFKKNRTLIIILLAVLVIACYFVYLLLNSTIKDAVNGVEASLLRLRDGNIPSEIPVNFIEMKKSVKALNYVSKKIGEVRDLALEIGKGNFNTKGELTIHSEGELGESLLKMQDTIAKVAEEDEKRNKVNEGLAKFSEVLGNYTNNLQKFGDEVILNLVKFLGANQGALFVVNNEDPDNPYMELVSTYANNKKKFVASKVIKGQGLVGQAWIEGKRIYMTEVPKNYVTITSGLGYSTPRCILIIPLKFNEEIHGVLELASFNELKDFELGFVEKVSESIASALSSVKVNSKTQNLLSQYEVLAEKTKNQENEMSSKVEELKQIQEESLDREEKYLSEIKRLKKRLKEYELNL